MAEEKKDDKNAGIPGRLDSSSPPGGAGNGDTTVETEKSESRVPYHKDPELQDYINRQVEKRWLDKEQENNKDKGKGKDELSDIVSELTEEFQLEPSLALKYAKIIEKVADRVAEKKIVGVKVNLKTVTLQHKINNFAASHPDLVQFKDDMLKTLQMLPEDEQDFIRNSENGLEYLYNKVKIRTISANPQQNKHLGGFGGGSGGGAKLNRDGGGLLEKASAAFRSGNVREYNALMTEHNASQK